MGFPVRPFSVTINNCQVLTLLNEKQGGQILWKSMLD